MRTSIVKAMVLGALMAPAAPWAFGQSNAELEALRREYDQQLRVMQQAFDERMTALEEGSKKKDSDFSWYWKDGLKFDSADGKFKMKLGGSVLWDNAFYDGGDDIEDAQFDSDGDGVVDTPVFGEYQNGSEFRRARLEIGGVIYENFEFMAQYDFAGDNDTDFKDVWLQSNTPYGKIRGGHFKEPFSLEALTSSANIQFMERAQPATAFAPSRNGGIAYFNSFHENMITVAGGIFRTTDDNDPDSTIEDEYAFTGRATARPWVNEEGTQYLHLGAAGSYRNADEDRSTARFRERPESHITDIRLVDTGTISGVDDALLLGAEAAFVYGPFAAQAEYIHTTVSVDDSISNITDDGEYDGWYVQASYFVTGENRQYRAEDGFFDKVKPNSNFNGFGREGGPGAWEVAARYSQLDLDDEVNGGQQSDITLGVNWYLNPNIRWGLNYVHAHIDREDTFSGTFIELDDSVNVIQTRMQVTW